MEPHTPPAGNSPYLLDERSVPSFRRTFGRHLVRAREVRVAVARIRLSGVDLGREEVEGLRRLQVLTVAVNAQALSLEAEALARDPERRANLLLIRELAGEGRLEIRAAPLGGWSPDFSVFSQEGGPAALLVGPHWFQRPFPYRGPALASLHGPAAAARMTKRFQELWAEAHDVAGAVLGVLERTEARHPEPRKVGSPRAP